MENISKDIITLLQYLLPGFISAWIFHALTAYPKSSEFERIVQALIFTVLIQPFVYVAKTILFIIGRFISIADWNKDSQLFWSVVCAIMIGFVFSFYANNDKIHKIIRNRDISRETAYPSEWYSALINDTYLVLHLKGERRIYGWPTEWPSDPNKGHFLLKDASWLIEKKEENGETSIKEQDQIPLTGVDGILIDAKQVEMIEFMENTWDTKNEQETIQPTTTAPEISTGRSLS